jgi:hypothetical protein
MVLALFNLIEAVPFPYDSLPVYVFWWSAVLAGRCLSGNVAKSGNINSRVNDAKKQKTSVARSVFEFLSFLYFLNFPFFPR